MAKPTALILRKCAKCVFVILTASAVIWCVWYLLMKEVGVSRTIDLLKVRVGNGNTIPEPANIEYAGDWYFLDHISSGLVAFDHVEGKFVPMLAEWNSHRSGVHSFTLMPNARFNDGTPITADDVVASIKRLLIKKTSTHFPLWEYIQGCDHLNQLDESCPGLIAVNDKTIEIRLKTESESFFLQLASPETGIWSAKDIASGGINKFQPTQFSGPYGVEKIESNGMLLTRNENSFVVKKHPHAPKQLFLSTLSIDDSDKLLELGELDLSIRGYKPFAEKDWKNKNILVHATAPSALIYFHGTDLNSQQLIGQDFINTLWQNKTESELVVADKFLPFAGSYSHSREELLSQLPEKSKKHIRLAVPWTYLSDGFLNIIVEAGKKIGTNIEIIRLDRNVWRNAFEDPKAKERYDFIIGVYAASERYPAVQLRYITGSTKKPEIDLKLAETPDLTNDKINILKDYQKWLLKNGHALPLFFIRNLIIHQNNIDLGDQPPSDAEIELWRVMRK